MDGNPDLSALGVDPAQAAAYQQLETQASHRALATALLGGLAAAMSGPRRYSIGRALGAAGRTYNAAEQQAIAQPLAMVKAAQEQKRQALLDQEAAARIPLINAQVQGLNAALPGKVANSQRQQQLNQFEPTREGLVLRHNKNEQARLTIEQRKADAAMANAQANLAYKGLHARFSTDADGNTFAQPYRLSPDGSMQVIGDPQLVYAPSKAEQPTTSIGEINWGAYRKGADKAFGKEFTTYRQNAIAQNKNQFGQLNPNFKPPTMSDFMQSPEGRKAFRRATGKEMPEAAQKTYPTAPEGYKIATDDSSGSNLNANDDPRLKALPRGVSISLKDGRTMLINEDGSIAISDAPSTSVAPANGPGVPLS